MQYAIEVAQALYRSDVGNLTFNEFSDTEHEMLSLVHREPGRLDVAQLAGLIANQQGIQDRRARLVVNRLRETDVLVLDADRKLRISSGSGLGDLLLDEMYGETASTHAVRASTSGERCHKWMTRAQARCIRIRGHKGPCRSK